MSGICTGKDALEELKTRIAACLTDHCELHNPYELDLNAGKILNKGWGVKVSSGEEWRQNICPDKAAFRNFEIILTLLPCFKGADPCSDAGNLLEEFECLKVKLCEEPILGSNTLDYVNDSGIEIEKVGENDKAYYVITGEFRTRYTHTTK